MWNYFFVSLVRLTVAILFRYGNLNISSFFWILWSYTELSRFTYNFIEKVSNISILCFVKRQKVDACISFRPAIWIRFRREIQTTTRNLIIQLPTFFFSFSDYSAFIINDFKTIIIVIGPENDLFFFQLPNILIDSFWASLMYPRELDSFILVEPSWAAITKSSCYFFSHFVTSYNSTWPVNQISTIRESNIFTATNLIFVIVSFTVIVADRKWIATKRSRREDRHLADRIPHPLLSTRAF